MILLGRRRHFRGEKLDVAPVDGPLLAFVLLGLNGGMYSKDIADLDHVDVKRIGGARVIDAHRGKTGAYRRTPLWPETAKAMDAVATKGPGGPLFKTSRGNRWNHGETDAINQEFCRRLEQLGIKRDGVAFGALRHTHVSAVGDQGDLTAARIVRGHKVGGIESHYDLPDLKRLTAVTNFARRRLLPSPAVRPTSPTAPAPADPA